MGCFWRSFTGVTDCWQRRCPRLGGPELGPVIQRMYQLGGQLDVVAHYLLVLGNAVDVADSASQVSVHTGAQLTLPELEGANTKLTNTCPGSSSSRNWPIDRTSDWTVSSPRTGTRSVLLTDTGIRLM